MFGSLVWYWCSIAWPDLYSIKTTEFKMFKCFTLNLTALWTCVSFSGNFKRASSFFWASFARKVKEKLESKQLKQNVSWNIYKNWSVNLEKTTVHLVLSYLLVPQNEAGSCQACWPSCQPEREARTDWSPRHCLRSHPTNTQSTSVSVCSVL